MQAFRNLKQKKKGIWALAAGLLFLLAVFFAFLIYDALNPFPGKEVSWSTTIHGADGSLLHAFLSEDEKWRIKASIDEITPELEKTILFKEDRYFRYHPGINPIAVVRAAFNNLKKGRRTSGASTITMQLARMMRPAPRTISAKLLEMVRAFQLEWHFTKDEILQMYFNLLPFGGNVEGVKTASLIYFGETPEELSLSQTVMLTVIPNDPNRLKPGRGQSALLTVRNRWLRAIGEAGLFDKDIIRDALEEPLPERIPNVPRQAPHLSYRLRQLAGNAIYTFINPEVQYRVETQAVNYVRSLRAAGVENLAVLVVNNRTMAVEAYLGSAGFGEDAFQGQVDGITALRSPGSALKPFLYSLAFDAGLITPRLVITDVPKNFGGYRPENYDETYRGSVTAGQALALSLNLPAVELLDRLGVEPFASRLSRSGFRWIGNNRKKLGLSLVLGGCGTTLEELTAAYAALANRGVYKPLRFFSGQDSAATDTLCSAGAAYVITESLTQLQRPDLPAQYRMSAGLPAIAWKTGTSYGRRDGWAIGYNTEYTIGIWTGNFPGTGVAGLNGADFAVPLLFSLFSSPEIKKSNQWFTPPPELDYRLVCSESGLPPDTFCHHRVMDYFLPGISPAQRCNHLKRYYVNQPGTLSYCSQCLPDKGYRQVLLPYHPPALLAWYRQMQMPCTVEPPHNPACPSVRYTGAPVITSLTDGAEYLLLKGRRQKLQLACNTESGISTVFWYLNDKFYQSSAPDGYVFFTPGEGVWKISCSDNLGRNSDISIRVSWY